MKYDGLIFDIDGTLWDVTLALENSWNETLTKMGIPKRVTQEQMKSVMGHPLEECVEIVLPDVKELHGEIISELLENDLEKWARKQAVIYDGVKAGFRELAQNHQIFLVSNCGDRYLHLFLKLAGVGPQVTAFDCWGLSRIAKCGMIKKLVDKYSLKKTVYVGDTTSDYDGARGAGVDFIQAAYGFGQKIEGEKAFDNFSDLARYLGK